MRKIGLLLLIGAALVIVAQPATAQKKSPEAGPYRYYHLEHTGPRLPNPFPPPYPGPMPPWWPPYHPWPYPGPAPYGPDDRGTVIRNPYAPTGRGPSTSLLPPPTPTQAVLVIQTPTTQTDLWVDGIKMPFASETTRVFTSPALEPGHAYQYTVKAAFVQRAKMVSRERDVKVQPGKTVTVDFTK